MATHGELGCTFIVAIKANYLSTLIAINGCCSVTADKYTRTKVIKI